MSREVRLPSEEWIPLQNLVRDVAESILPIKLDAIKGIECIVGVEWDVDATQPLAMEASAPDSSGVSMPEGDDAGIPPQELDQSHHDQKEILTFSSLFSLLPSGSLKPIDKYRQDLELLLCDLPLLDYPITEDKKSAFLSALKNHPNRPSIAPPGSSSPPLGRPHFLDAKYMEKRYREHEELTDNLSQYLVAAADRHEEKLIIVNSQRQYVPLQTVHGGFANLFIRQDSAFAFVTSLGLAPIVADLQDHPVGIYTNEGKERVWRGGKKGRWSEDEIGAVFDFLAVTNPSTGKQKYSLKLAAKLIGVSSSALSQKLKEYRNTRQDAGRARLSISGQLASSKRYS